MSSTKSHRISLKIANNQLKGDVWAADKLLRKRITKKRGIEYLVKWRGYGLKYASWEPESNLLDKRLIRNFNLRSESDKKNSVHANSSTSRENLKTKYSERKFRTIGVDSTKIFGSPSKKRKVGRPKKSRVLESINKIDDKLAESSLKTEDSSPSKLSAKSSSSHKTSSTEPLSNKDKIFDSLIPYSSKNEGESFEAMDLSLNISPPSPHANPSLFDSSDRYSTPLKSKDNVVFTDVTSNDFTVTIKEVLPLT